MKKRIGILSAVVALLIIALLGVFIYSNNFHHHEYGEWEIVKSATCTKPGERMKTCSCGKEIVEEIPATGHTEVVDEAVAATCTKKGLTQGSHCSVCKKVIVAQESTPVVHEEKEIPAIAATCTKAGKTSGTVCILCGQIVKEQEKIQAQHNYANGVCTVCHKEQPDVSAAIDVDQLNENVPMCFSTKKAYAGGSTINFQAYVPKEAGWWAVCWTTDLTDKEQVGLYKWAKHPEIGKTFHYGNDGTTQKKGEWEEYSATLPNDGKQYYIYFVAGKGSWKGKELLIDEVQITNASGKVIAEDNFDNGVEEGLFSIIHYSKSTGKAIVYGKEHNKVAITATEPLCTEAGCTAGIVCSICGKVYEESHKIPALGHNWVDKKCTVCGSDYVNIAAGINIDKLSLGSPMNFITEKAYPAGSTITFKAFVPEGSGWWSVNWTTAPDDNTKTGVYKFTSGSGKSFHYGNDGTTQKKGEWEEYAVTLPLDGGPYYVYIVGAVGNWKGQELLIDDCKIISSDGKVLAEDTFDNGLQAGIFNAVEQSSKGEVVVREVAVIDPCENGHTIVTEEAVEPTCTTPGKTAGSYCSICKTVFEESVEIPALGHDWKDGVCNTCGKTYENIAAAISIDKLNAGTPMNFITKKAYPAGSTITFRAYVPENTGWWSVNWTTAPTDNSQTGLYKFTEGKGKSFHYGNDGTTQKKGEWAEYTVTLPDEGGVYYVYIVGAKGQWNGQELLVDDFKITNAGGATVAEDTFDKGLTGGIFNITTAGDGGATAVRAITVEEEKEEEKANRIAAINIDKLYAGAPMNFITKKAYPAGSTITFRAYVPENTGWWSVNWTTAPTDNSQTGLYKFTAGKGKSFHYGNDGTTQKKGEWAEYSVTLPDEGGPYYVYIVGAKGQWNGQELLVDEFKITNAGGAIVAEDAFDDGLTGGIFDITTTGDGGATAVRAITEEKANQIAAINIDKLYAGAPMNFITKKAYPAGSTITFRAYVPENTGWWSVNWTTAPTDNSQTGLYKFTAGKGKSFHYGNDGTIQKKGEWAEYTVTLPDEGGPYYVYIVGAKGQWNGQELLVDDFKITNASGTVIAEDTFDDGLTGGIFNITTTGDGGATTVRETTETAEITDTTTENTLSLLGGFLKELFTSRIQTLFMIFPV